MRIKWALTWDCNFHCSYCYIPFNQKTNNILNITNIDKIIQTLQILCLKEKVVIHLIGGEISLYPDIVIHIMQKLPYAYFILYTNLSKILFLEKLAQLSFKDRFHIVATYHNRKINRNVFEKNLFFLNHNNFINSECLLMFDEKTCMSIIREYQKWCVLFSNIYIRNLPINNSIKYITANIKKLLNINNIVEDKFEDRKYKNFICEVPKTGFYISPTGKLYPCENYCYNKLNFLYDMLSMSIDIPNLLNQTTLCDLDECTYCGQHFNKYKARLL